MAKKTITTTNAPILPGTPEMEAFLSVGYDGMTIEKANVIIQERRENPQSWPYEMLEKAQAFLAAYSARAVVIDNSPHWERTEV
jgi:hypothetical protein